MHLGVKRSDNLVSNFDTSSGPRIMSMVQFRLVVSALYVLCGFCLLRDRYDNAGIPCEDGEFFNFSSRHDVLGPLVERAAGSAL